MVQPMTNAHTDPSPTGARPVTRINPNPWAAAVGFDHAQLRPFPSQVVTVSAQGSTAPDGALLHEGDVTAQLALAVANLEEVLRDAGMGLADVAKLTVYATDIPAVHAAHGALFERLAATGATPPITLVGVTELAAPGMAVALDALALR
jgi:enamine deaminase RidA (YjgF/YER057c/UK114 family)